MSDYTPALDVVRETYISGVPVLAARSNQASTSPTEAGKEFDRWLDAIKKAAYNDGYSDGRWDW